MKGFQTFKKKGKKEVKKKKGVVCKEHAGAEAPLRSLGRSLKAIALCGHKDPTGPESRTWALDPEDRGKTIKLKSSRSL